MIDPYATPPAGASGPPAPRGSGWAWFFAGTTLALAVMLGAVLWALTSTGLYPQLIARLGPTSRMLVEHPTSVLAPPAVPTAAPQASSPRLSPSSPARAARLGEIVESGTWKLLVNGLKTEPSATGRRATVEFTLKNDQDRAATLTIPATIPAAPRARPASLDAVDWPSLIPIQLAEPPALRLNVLDAADRPFGGGFVSAAGQTSGSYTFEAAPRDAIRLTYAFELPAGTADPVALDVSFGVDAGGQRARINLDGKVESPVGLAPSDPPKSAGKEERLQVGSLWAITVQSLEVGAPGSDGQRTVTARLKMDNLSDQSMAAGATPDDPTGGGRDFYAVDAQGHLAYSSSDSMPRTSVPSKQSRMLEVKLKATGEFASAGPYRLSVVIDARRDRYAVFKIP